MGQGEQLLHCSYLLPLGPGWMDTQSSLQLRNQAQAIQVAVHLEISAEPHRVAEITAGTESDLLQESIDDGCRIGCGHESSVAGAG